MSQVKEMEETDGDRSLSLSPRQTLREQAASTRLGGLGFSPGCSISHSIAARGATQSLWLLPLHGLSFPHLPAPAAGSWGETF